MYSDEKIKEEKLIEYTQGMVRELKRTSYIKMFSTSLLNYMPKYNELKHFNPLHIAQRFMQANNLQLSTATYTTMHDTMMNMSGMSDEEWNEI